MSRTPVSARHVRGMPLLKKTSKSRFWDVLYLDHGVREVHLQLGNVGSGLSECRESDVQAIYLSLHLRPLLVQQELVEADQL